MFIHAQSSVSVTGMRRCRDELIYLMKQEQRHSQQEDLLCIQLYWENCIPPYLYQRMSQTTDTYWALNYSSFFGPVRSCVSLCIFFVQVYTTVMISSTFFFFFDSLQQSIDLQNNWTFQWSQQENSFSSCLFWIIKTPTSAITVNKRGKKNAAHCFLTTHHRGRSLTGMQMENNAIKHRQSLDLHPLANLHACSPKQV